MIAALVALAMAQAQTGPWTKYQGPFKLVITWNQSITVVDYPSFVRCDAARKAVEAEVQQRARENLAAMPEGTRVVGRSTNGAFCIPG